MKVVFPRCRRHGAYRTKQNPSRLLALSPQDSLTALFACLCRLPETGFASGQMLLCNISRLCILCVCPMDLISRKADAGLYLTQESAGVYEEPLTQGTECRK